MKVKLTTVMNPVRSTPGTFLFEVPSNKKYGAKVSNLYIKRDAFPGMDVPPEEITVTVEFDDKKG